MTELAKLIRIHPGKGLEIDGQEFPWYCTEDGATVHTSRNSWTAVTVAIVCDRVEVVDPWEKSVQRPTWRSRMALVASRARRGLKSWARP